MRRPPLPGSPGLPDWLNAVAGLGAPWRRLAVAMAGAAERAGRPLSPGLLALAFRDMPYARPSRPADTGLVIGEWRGTCSGKHMALQQALSAAGLPARLAMARHRMLPDTPWLPEAVRALLPPHGIEDIHNFLLVRTEAGEAVLDITWPGPLAAAGFPVAGLTLTEGQPAVRAEEIRSQPPGPSGDAAKRRWLAEICGSRLAEREAAIAELIRFAQAHAPAAPMDETLARSLAGGEILDRTWPAPSPSPT